MTAAPHFARALRLLPLAVLWLVAAWPVVLWLVHRHDPVAAVQLAAITRSLLWRTAVAASLGIAFLLLVYPPAPAFVRLYASHTWRQLTTDQTPLRRALADLRHFATAPRHLEVGRLARLRDNLPLAQQQLEQAVALDPEVASAQHQLGLVLFAQRRFGAALSAFEAAERLEPGHAFGDALLHCGRTQYELGEFAAARTTLEQHRQRHGGSQRSHLWLAEALDRSGDRAGASTALATAAAPPSQRLSPEDNWCRALARVRLWGRGGKP